MNALGAHKIFFNSNEQVKLQHAAMAGGKQMF